MNNCRKGIISIFAGARSCRTLFLPAWICLVLLLAQQQSAQAAGFSAAAGMGTARQSHTATLLNDGSVLVTGGYNGSSILNSAELYNPDGTFTPIEAPMNVARRDHTATRLADGRVLIAGGLATGSTVSNTAEIFDPLTKSFTPTGSMNNGSGTASLGRVVHTATLLSSGKVLITGGRRGTLSSTTLNTAELYDPGTGLFTATGALKQFRANHTATLLSDGRVFIAGGFINSSTLPNATSSAEIFDAAGVSSTATPTTMLTARGYHAAVLLKDNTVLITGGSSGSSIGSSQNVSLTSAEIFNPASGGSFSSAGTMWFPHSSHSATLLTSGRVLIAGSMDRTTFSGITSGTAELYRPDAAAGNRFDPEFDMAAPRASYPAVLLANGTVLLAGGLTTDIDGFTTHPTAAAEIYNPWNITVAPVVYTFSDRAVGSTSPSQSFTITNAAGFALTIDTGDDPIVISGAGSAMFAMTNSCPTSVPVGGNCSVNVTFTPTSVGTHSASLDIYYWSETQLEVWSVPLQGTGTVPTTSTLTVTFAATGAGSVHSSSTPAPVPPLQEISCVGGAGTPCQGQFNNGTTVTLSATADSSNSLFGGWTGAGCSGTGNCVINNLSANTAVTASFNYVEPARINSTYYPSLQGAYAGAFAGNVIEARAVTFTGPLDFNRDIGVTLKGGHDLYYSPVGAEYSVVDGKLTISKGLVSVQRIVVRGGE